MTAPNARRLRRGLPVGKQHLTDDTEQLLVDGDRGHQRRALRLILLGMQAKHWSFDDAWEVLADVHYRGGRPVQRQISASGFAVAKGALRQRWNFAARWL